MATKELDNFVFKFKNLWNAGIEANLSVNTRDGQAWVQLQVGLGRPLDLRQPYHHGHDGSHRAGGTSRQRRRMRRESSRKVGAAAEEAATDTVENIEAGTAEQVAAGKSEEGQEKFVEDTNCNDTGYFECEVSEDSMIPQIDGNADLKDDDKVYELKIEAHEKCKNHDIVEAIEVN